MIERIALYKLNDDEDRESVAAELRKLGANAVSCAVGIPADEPSLRSWDVSLVLRFADLDARDAFLASEAFVAHEKEFATRTQVVKHWSFAIRK